MLPLTAGVLGPQQGGLSAPAGVGLTSRTDPERTGGRLFGLRSIRLMPAPASP